MAPGYEIALWLTGLGLLCRVAGLWRLRAEERARTGGLKTVLRAGPVERRAAPSRWRLLREPIRMVPQASAPIPRPEAAAPSAALAALQRAFRGGYEPA